jgi:hypothetical protein
VTSPLPDPAPVVGLVVAGRSEGLREHVRRFDQALPAHVPLLCQAADVTVGEIATWLEHPERLAGFDGLFIANGPIATLVPGPFLAQDLRAVAEAFSHSLGRYVVWIADSPALILPRVVCMLANEAAFAVGEGVADGDTIDRAMTLGVNYSQGLWPGPKRSATGGWWLCWITCGRNIAKSVIGSPRCCDDGRVWIKSQPILPLPELSACESLSFETDVPGLINNERRFTYGIF